ncbi:MAG: hypothetical protein IKA85_00875 [Clostridia bacterium]|nr:hypothetical protein [Clostridia bacterium]
MKSYVTHPTYGNIVYDENFWSGKKSIFVNGNFAKRLTKKDFIVDGKSAILKGNFLTGATLQIEGETIVLCEKPKIYEFILALLPFIFILTWGNSPTLCLIFPVIGGAIGGALGALAFFTSLILMKKTKSPLYKIIIGAVTFIVTVLIAFILAIAFVLILY